MTVDALVDEVESLRTFMPSRRGTDENGGGGVEKRNYRVTYVLEDDGNGGLAEIVEERKYWADEAPTQGSQVMAAYEPGSEMAKFKVLESTEQNYWRKVQATRQLISDGLEAPVVVTDVKATGRVARPLTRFGDLRADRPDIKIGEVNPARVANEVHLSLKVSPPGGEEFEITRRYWDRQIELEEGTEGLLFYDPNDPEQGIPHFPDADEKQIGGDAVAIARQNLIDSISNVKVPKKYRD